MNKKEKIAYIDQQISELNGAIKTLANERNALQVVVLEEEMAKLDSSDIESQFRLWVESTAPKDDFGWINDCTAPTSKTDLFEYDLILYWERGEVLSIESIAEIFEEILLDLNGSGTGRYPCTKLDVHEWMAGLMKMNFGSSAMDW